VSRGPTPAPRVLALAALALGACTDDTDPPWQLDHDRIIAVRATPPRIPAGGSAEIDDLIGAKGAPVAERAADAITVVSPASLAAAIRHEDRWRVVAPDEVGLAAARAELQLAASAAVPLVIEVQHGALRATKTVWLGGTGANPAMVDIDIDGAGDPAAVTVPALRDVPLAIALDDAAYDVTWLASCGTMHDFDLPSAYLRVEADDPQSGQLALVVRDATGGVNWRIWPISAE
jgi:hypothetical protein